MSPIPPGATIGILGGGQLGRMTAMAAARLGYRCHIFAPEAESPAADVAAAFTRAPYEDEAALAAFADAVDVVTLEFENVLVAAGRAPRPPSPAAWAEVLRVTQDRLEEKGFVSGLGIPVTAYAPVANEADLVAASASARACSRPRASATTARASCASAGTPIPGRRWPSCASPR